jgi:hypothetical protein
MIAQTLTLTAFLVVPPLDDGFISHVPDPEPPTVIWLPDSLTDQIERLNEIVAGTGYTFDSLAYCACRRDAMCCDGYIDRLCLDLIDDCRPSKWGPPDFM